MGILMRDTARSNPGGFIGQDLEEIIIPAAGAGVTSYANDQIIQPVAQRFAPGIFAQTGLIGKLADAGTTYATAEAVGFAGGFINPRVGALLGMGGKIVAGAKLLLAFIPNVYHFQVGLTLPKLGQLAATPPVLIPTPPALPAASAATVTASTPTGAYTPVSL